ncbi:MAG: glycosyltransferase family 2 protein [Leptospirales bacterium]
MRFSKISVLIPTRKRPDYLKRMLESYEKTLVNSNQSELIFRCDNDDMETISYLSSTGFRIIIGPRLDGYKSLPVFFNEMVKIADGDLFICGNDDMLFKTRNWPQLIIDEANKYPDGIFNIGVSTGLNDDKFPFSIVSRQLVDAMGLINDPRLLFSDIFLLDVTKYFNRAIRFSGVSIFHDWAGHSDDLTRREANQHEFNEVFADKQGNWSDSYRNLQEKVVSETINRITRNSDVMSEIILNNFSQYSPPPKTSTSNITGWPPQSCPQNWGTGPSQKTIHYNRQEVKRIIDEILKRGISRDQIVLTSLNNGLPSILWGEVFKKVLTISSLPNKEEFFVEQKHTVASGSTGDGRFLYRIIKSIGTLNALILDDTHYSNLISPYYLFRHAITKPGIIIFNNTANRSTEHKFIAQFINELQTGTLDGITHEIHHIWSTNGFGMSFEIVE